MIFVLLTTNIDLLFAQFEADSLRKVFQQSQHDTTKLRLSVELASTYTFKNFDSTIHYKAIADSLIQKSPSPFFKYKLEKLSGNIALWQNDKYAARQSYMNAILIVNQLNFKHELSKLHYNLTFTYLDNPDSARHYLEIAAKYALADTDSSLYFDILLFEVEKIHFRKSEFEQASVKLEKMLLYAERNHNKELEFKARQGLGRVYYRGGNTDLSLEHFHKALQIATESNNTLYQAHTSINLAMVYSYLGDFVNTEKYQKTALEHTRKFQNPYMLANILTNIYESLVAQEKYDEAAPYFNEAIELVDIHDFNPLRASLYINSAKSETVNGNYEMAEIMFNKGISQARLDANYPWLAYGYENYVKLDSLQQNYKRALLHKDSFLVFTDSVRNQETRNKIEELNIRYETNKKQQENNLLKEEARANELAIRNRNLTLFGVSVAMLLTFVLLFVIRKSKNKLQERNAEILNQKEEIETQAETLETNLQEIQKLNGFKEEMTQMLVHDLKNPLNVLINLPSNLPAQEKDEIRQYSAHKMLNLVMNILDVEKYENSELNVNIENISLIEVWDTAIKQLEHSIVGKNISIINKVKDEIIVSADKNLLERIFVNLLSNSIKYTAHNGEISLHCKILSEQTVRISVSDNGDGIPFNELFTIFDKYKQSGTSIKYSTGIGLTFCKIAIEAQGGEIFINSEVGMGTTVLFIIPFVKIKETENQSGNQTSKLNLSKADKLKLQVFYELLLQLDMSEISAFRKIFKAIETENIENQEWLVQIKASTYNQNKVQFDRLIEMING